MNDFVDYKNRPIAVGDWIVVFPEDFIKRFGSPANPGEWDSYTWLLNPIQIEDIENCQPSGVKINGGINNSPYGIHIWNTSIVKIPPNLSNEELLLYLALEGFTK